MIDLIEIILCKKKLGIKNKGRVSNEHCVR